MNGGIDYSNLVCNHHQDEGKVCNCAEISANMVMYPDEFPNMRHFIACMETAFEHEGVRVQRYMSDIITWDRRVLETEDPSLPFAYAVRASGTHLVRLGERDGVGHRSWQYPSFIGNRFSCEEVRWFWWDGQKMTRLESYLDAGELLREECEKRGLQRY